MRLPNLRRTLAALALLGAVASAGCNDLTRSYDYGEVHVTLTDRKGQPLGNVQVVLYDDRRTLAIGSTGPGGEYTFRFVPFGAMGVYAVPPEGYVAPLGGRLYVDGLQVMPGTRLDVPMTLAFNCCGTIDVFVQEPGGAPVPDVAVVVYSPTHLYSQRTGPNGYLRFEQLPGGNYGVRLDIPPGFAPPPGGSDVADGIILVDQDTLVTMTLVRTQPRAGEE